MAEREPEVTVDSLLERGSDLLGYHVDKYDLIGGGILDGHAFEEAGLIVEVVPTLKEESLDEVVLAAQEAQGRLYLGVLPMKIVNDRQAILETFRYERDSA